MKREADGRGGFQGWQRERNADDDGAVLLPGDLGGENHDVAELSGVRANGVGHRAGVGALPHVDLAAERCGRFGRAARGERGQAEHQQSGKPEGPKSHERE